MSEPCDALLSWSMHNGDVAQRQSGLFVSIPEASGCIRALHPLAGKGDKL